MQASLDALDDLVVLINKRLPVKAKRQNVRSSLRSGTILSSQAEQDKAAKIRRRRNPCRKDSNKEEVHQKIRHHKLSIYF